MAKITISIEDVDDLSFNISCISDPPIPNLTTENYQEEISKLSMGQRALLDICSFISSFMTNNSNDISKFSN